MDGERFGLDLVGIWFGCDVIRIWFGCDVTGTRFTYAPIRFSTAEW